MNQYMLIDAIIRQTMVLVARLATCGGKRIPLAHVANQIFLELTRELKANNVSSKVIADMFGLTLRAYHKKIKRLNENESDRASSLWEAVATFLIGHKRVTRAQLLRNFNADDHGMVTGIVNDLVESGLLFRSGRGPGTLYQVVAMDAALGSDTQRQDEIAAFVWTIVYRFGPLDLESLHKRLSIMDRVTLSEVVDRLVADGRVGKQRRDGVDLLASAECVLSSNPDGWEAAVFDHFQAVANVIANRADHARAETMPDPMTGGMTFHFDIDESHPLQGEIMELFQSTKERASELRRRADQHNDTRSDQPTNPFRTVFYLGQDLLGRDLGENEEKEGE